MSVRTAAVRADGTSELTGVYDMTALDPGPLSAELEAKLAELSRSLDERETKAQFKLEVFFAGGPRKTVPVRGVIACWTNGGFLHGGGDAAVYLCPQKDGDDTCMAPLDMQFSTGGRIVCTKCRRVSKCDDLIGQIVCEATTQRWAQILVKLFHRLDCNADLRICLARTGIIQASELEREKDLRGEAYDAVTREREWIAYSLRNIIADTATGAGLEERFRAFLEA